MQGVNLGDADHDEYPLLFPLHTEISLSLAVSHYSEKHQLLSTGLKLLASNYEGFVCCSARLQRVG